MRRAACLVTLCLAVSTTQAETPNLAALEPQVERITGAVYQGNAYQMLGALSEGGPRLTGTKGHADSVQWAIRELRAAGLQDVRTEKVKLASTWQRGTARGRIVAPTERPLDVISFGWTPSTPAGGVRGHVVLIDDGAPASWKPLTAKLKGAIIVLVPPRDRKPDDLNTLRIEQSIPQWAKAGAKAVLFAMSQRPNNVRGVGGFDDTIAALPIGVLGFEDASHIIRKADSKLEIELTITNTVGGPATFDNVVGEIKGTDPKAGWILVSGHLDSWDVGTGTQDNGSGVINVIETARVIAAAGPLKRTVRFVLWGGEEQFIVGSRAYTAAHASELGSCAVMINSDSGAGHVTGWHTGRDDIKAAVTPIAKTFLDNLGGASLTTELGPGSDHEAFAMVGVPTLLLAVDESKYDVIHHKVADTIEKVDRHALLSGIAVTAVTAYVIAMSTSPLGPRLDRVGIEKVMTKAGILELMRAKGAYR